MDLLEVDCAVVLAILHSREAIDKEGISRMIGGDKDEDGSVGEVTVADGFCLRWRNLAEGGLNAVFPVKSSNLIEEGGGEHLLMSELSR